MNVVWEHLSFKSVRLHLQDQRYQHLVAKLRALLFYHFCSDKLHIAIHHCFTCENNKQKLNCGWILLLCTYSIIDSNTDIIWCITTFGTHRRQMESSSKKIYFLKKIVKQLKNKKTSIAGIHTSNIIIFLPFLLTLGDQKMYWLLISANKTILLFSIWKYHCNITGILGSLHAVHHVVVIGNDSFQLLLQYVS